MLFLIPDDKHGSYEIFIDYAKTIGRYFSDVEYSTSFSAREHAVVFCMNGYLYKESKQRYPAATFVFVNLEQMVLPSHLARVTAFHAENPEVLHIDYSQQNIDRVQPTRSVWVPQLPPGRTFSVAKDIDVIFFGFVSPLRRMMLQELSSHGIQVHVFQRMFGRERDIHISRARVLLNIPLDDEHTIFPSLRIHWALYNGAQVVSVPHLDEPAWESPEIRRGLHMVEWKDAIAKIKDILQSPPYIPKIASHDTEFAASRIKELQTMIGLDK